MVDTMHLKQRSCASGEATFMHWLSGVACAILWHKVIVLSSVTARLVSDFRVGLGCI